MNSRGFNMNPQVRFSWRSLGILLLALLFLSSVVMVNQRLDGAPHWLLGQEESIERHLEQRARTRFQQRKMLTSDQQKDLLSYHNISWNVRRSPATFDRAGDGIRTHDILLGKQTLCQLSYTRNCKQL